MKKKLGIIVDSGINLSKVEAEKKGYHYVPLFIIEKSTTTYLDQVEIFKDDLYEKMKNKLELSTSQQSLGVMLSTVEKMLEEYEKVIVVPISSSMSGSFNTWKIVEQELDTPNLYIFDTKDMGISIEWALDIILANIEKGVSFLEIQKILTARSEKRYLFLSTSDFYRLRKSGRVSAIKSLIASLLKYNIALEYQGSPKLLSKTKSIEDSFDSMVSRIKDITKNSIIKNISFYHFFASNLSDRFSALINRAKTIFENLTISNIPNTIAVHIGNNSFGFALEVE
jgi:DegV family protein with EDD domain